MARNNNDIPVIKLPTGSNEGIIIATGSFDGPHPHPQIQRAHRDGGYSFLLQQKGSSQIEIDFQTYTVEAPTVLYMHPNQVHRLIAFKHATISSWIITPENLLPESLRILEELAPVDPLPLSPEPFAILAKTASLCIQLSERKQEKLHYQLLKESCNLLITLVASQYLAQTKPTHTYTRFEGITKAFKAELEREFTTLKRPASYAERLNVSTPYLNECVKTTTGHSASYHIQHRIVLEVKRLLHHSDQSVKEIAADLGYEDYSYFVRLFRKVAGMTPLTFRTKNLD